MLETQIYVVTVYIEILKIKQFYITDRSKAILLLWFYLFCVLESNVCAVWALCTFSYV